MEIIKFDRVTGRNYGESSNRIRGLKFTNRFFVLVWVEKEKTIKAQ